MGNGVMLIGDSTISRLSITHWRGTASHQDLYKPDILIVDGGGFSLFERSLDS
jgi:hypothetical protein